MANKKALKEKRRRKAESRRLPEEKSVNNEPESDGMEFLGYLLRRLGHGDGFALRHKLREFVLRDDIASFSRLVPVGADDFSKLRDMFVAEVEGDQRAEQQQEETQDAPVPNQPGSDQETAEGVESADSPTDAPTADPAGDAGVVDGAAGLPD